MNVCVASAFRNAPQPQVQRWVNQVHRLHDAMTGHTVRCVAVEGDSTDDTRFHLFNHLDIASHYQENFKWDIVTCNHGGPVFGSTESPDRMACLSLVGNAIFDSVRDSDDVLVYVESDLIWTPETIMSLIEHLANTDVVAPLVFAGDNFYDVYCYRGLDGSRFSPFAPFHESLVYTILRLETDGTVSEFKPPKLFPVSSVGSCLVMHGHVARSARIRNGQALVGWCEDARSLGYRISVALGLRVEHPV